MPAAFPNRAAAGKALAQRLGTFADREDVLVLALPRGGVPVAFEVAQQLRLPLDVIVVRKLGVPHFPELAMGAITGGGVCILNEQVLRHLSGGTDIVDQVAAREAAEVERREREYREGRPPVSLEGRTVILVDDGLATGASMRAAVAAVKQQGAKAVVVAVPAGSAETCAQFRHEVDETICLISSHDFHSVGEFYHDFSQTSGDEVRALLRSAMRQTNEPRP